MNNTTTYWLKESTRGTLWQRADPSQVDGVSDVEVMGPKMLAAFRVTPGWPTRRFKGRYEADVYGDSHILLRRKHFRAPEDAIAWIQENTGTDPDLGLPDLP